MAPEIRVTQYTVSCFPEGHEDASSWDIVVEYRGPNRWAVTRFQRNYDADGNMEYEASPSNRTDDFKKRFRFDLETALKIAVRVAPTVVVNGMTPAQALEQFPMREGT